MAGGPALFVFLAVPLLTAGACVLLLRHVHVPLLRPHDSSARVQHVRVFAVSTFVTALVFWLWAVYHCIARGLDLGVITFLFPLTASTLLLAMRSDTPSDVSVSRLKWQRWVVALTPLLPAANFLLGVSKVLGTGKVLLLVFYVAGAVGWVVNGVLGFMLVTAQLRDFSVNQAVLIEFNRSQVGALDDGKPEQATYPI